MNQRKSRQVHSGCNLRGYHKGFSLIEVMTVIGILGILVAVGYPSYVDHVRSGKRSRAMADLLSFASAMESHKAQQYSYQGAGPSGANTGAPEIYNAWSPADQPKANRDYELTISSITDNGRGYELKATPYSGGAMKSDGMLIYRSNGVKGWDSDNSGSVSSSELCWECD